MGLLNFQKIRLKSSRSFQDFPNLMASFFKDNSINLSRKQKSNNHDLKELHKTLKVIKMFVLTHNVENTQNHFSSRCRSVRLGEGLFQIWHQCSGEYLEPSLTIYGRHHVSHKPWKHFIIMCLWPFTKHKFFSVLHTVPVYFSSFP